MLAENVEIARYLVISFILCYSTSFGPVPWVLVGEILPAKGVGLTVMMDWTGMTILSLFFKPVAAKLGMHNMFFFFSGCNIFVFFYIFVIDYRHLYFHSSF